MDFDGLVAERLADGSTYRLETSTTTVEIEASTVANATERSMDELRQSLEPIGPFVTNWYVWERTVGGRETARRAFLRWCEGAPLDDPKVETVASKTDTSDVLDRYDALESGVVRHWGELQITTRLATEDGGCTGTGTGTGTGAGERVYEIRHVQDADATDETLEDHDDPRDAREIVTYDADGRYRPLKTAPTLVAGWRFAGLSGDDLVETVRTIYPATVANWHREQCGDLDVDHWLETAERQTGIYDVIDELPRETLEWLTEACCVDSQCLKRREWEYAADDPIDTDPGDGVFPCREPCSLVIAAARKWAILESEEEKTWELELTTTEMNQLAEIVDAVADGRVDEIREADVYDGANRYRARYLRAKRMDDGSLGEGATNR
ncbi:DR2241 family protein [Natronosalvus rutilus]|uniref:DR2241 family protein n=1 Tax=Natronosalvus rutilus TaxID=2953753 RepID=A0A9E7NBQ2_9EURY|nr:DR2241 family protein [Natronosalvus rutilus]UTF55499.1 DR2241 family protein [Natronosalvus rutilus]